MGFFNKTIKTRYGALIDIGSGSVLTAIIASKPNENHPQIIWAKREHVTLRKIESLNDSIKQIISALLNASLTLNGEGRKTMFDTLGTQQIDRVQVTVSAPWAYVNTKNISYKANGSFEISEELVAELLKTADQKTEEEIQAEERLHSHELTAVVKTTLQILANGYPIEITNNQKAESLSVVESTGIIQDRLLMAIQDTLGKVFPSLNFSVYPFMLPFYYVMRDSIQPATEFCLVNVTKEATELGIIRDGILSHVSHTPFGSFSIAREIAEALSVPLEEAYGYITCDDFKCFIQKASEGQQKDVEVIITAYQNRLSQLFLETGDALAIPKRIYLHSDYQTEPFFETYISRGASSATKMQHAVYLVTKNLISKYFEKEESAKIKNFGMETSILMSAQFFHTNRQTDRFTNL